MKVVINNCFGGFGLSPLATREYAKRKGHECYFFIIGEYAKDHNAVYKPATLEEASGKSFFDAYTQPVMDSAFAIREWKIERTDPDLVAVVEALGEKANGSCASLKVIEVPDDARWEIQEYDGNEHVAEVHRTWD